MGASRQSFIAVLSAELKRVFGRSKSLVSLGIFALVSIAMYGGALALIGFASETAELSAEASNVGFIGFSLPLSLLSMCLGIYAAAFSARDYNDGFLLSSLLVVPNRARLFAVRMLPWICASLAASLVAFGVCLVLSLGSGEAVGTMFAQMVLAVISCVCSTILGFCCGSITKKGSLSVFLYLGLTFILPTAFGTASIFVPEAFSAVFNVVQMALPGVSFPNIVGIVQPAGQSSDALGACIVTAVWTIGLPVVSFFLFKTRATLGR